MPICSQDANEARDIKIKIYVRAELLQSKRWAELKEEFGYTDLGNELEGDDLTPDAMGIGAHAFFSGGKDGDQHWYAYQTAPLSQRIPKRPIKAEEAEGKMGETSEVHMGGEKAGTKKNGPRRRHGRDREDGRLKDIEDGLYEIFESEGRRGKGKAIYVYLMKEFGLESEIKPGRQPNPTHGVKKGPNGKAENGLKGSSSRSGKDQACGAFIERRFGLVELVICIVLPSSKCRSFRCFMSPSSLFWWC
jgi:hypothetical protein